MPYSVYVYAICKNESKFVDRWMDSMSEADGVVVVDTGSTDDTVEKLRARGAVVHEETFTPWRFDVPRNVSLGLVPDDADICVCTDLDEVFHPGWRAHLEASWTPNTDQGEYFYTWEYHADGSPKKQYIREKIHTRKHFKWVHPVHEVLEYSGKTPKRTKFLANVILDHHPDLSKPRSQYLPLLELAAKENPQDDRTMFWLGREYFFYKKLDDAIKTLEFHLSLKGARWSEERAASMRYIALSYKEQGKMGKAKQWLYRSAAECPTIREAFYELVELNYQLQDYPAMYAFGLEALKIKDQSGSYLMETKCWDYRLEDYVGIAAFHLGLYEEALKHATNAYQKNSTDLRLKNNVALIAGKVQGGTA